VRAAPPGPVLAYAVAVVKRRHEDIVPSTISLTREHAQRKYDALWKEPGSYERQRAVGRARILAVWLVPAEEGGRGG